MRHAIGRAGPNGCRIGWVAINRMQQSSVSRVALIVLAVIAAGAAMNWAAGILTPLVLALFLTVLIDSFARTGSAGL